MDVVCWNDINKTRSVIRYTETRYHTSSQCMASAIKLARNWNANEIPARKTLCGRDLVVRLIEVDGVETEIGNGRNNDPLPLLLNQTE